MRSVDAALVPELLEDPPHRLHEAEVHRLVVVVEVDPAAHARDGLAPFTDVLEHHRAALFVELVDAELLDLRSPSDAKRLLGKRLDRKAVGIPAEASLDVLAAHRLVTRNDVLDCAGEQVSVVGKTSGKRRPVVELVALLAFVFLKRLRKRSVLLPERENLLLHLREGDFIRYRLEHHYAPIRLKNWVILYHI